MSLLNVLTSLIKRHVRKAFDTLDWSFLLEVLRTFGFCDKFRHWIKTILESARLSFSINGKSADFISCSRGVRQGNPLSPLLFCRVEEMLSRGIQNLVVAGCLQLMSGPRGALVPSHAFFADDLMIFCRGHKQSLTHSRVNFLASNLGFNPGNLPFNYLGIPIFTGKPRKNHLLPIVDRIKAKLATWKGKLLSYMGRVQLVKSVLHGILIHSFTVYPLPTNLLNHLEKAF